MYLPKNMQLAPFLQNCKLQGQANNCEKMLRTRGRMDVFFVFVFVLVLLVLCLIM